MQHAREVAVVAHVTSDRVTAMTAHLHTLYCLPGANPRIAWTEGHRYADQAKAVRLLEGLGDAGWHLCALDFMAEVGS